jgi:hypothetical protein
VPEPAGRFISSNVVKFVFATPPVVAGKPLESKPSVVIGVYGVVVCSAPDVPSTTLPSRVAYTSQLLSVPPEAASSSLTKKYCRICGSPNESYTVVDVDELYVPFDVGSNSIPVGSTVSSGVVAVY